MRERVCVVCAYVCASVCVLCVCVCVCMCVYVYAGAFVCPLLHTRARVCAWV